MKGKLGLGILVALIALIAALFLVAFAPPMSAPVGVASQTAVAELQTGSVAGELEVGSVNRFTVMEAGTLGTSNEVTTGTSITIWGLDLPALGLQSPTAAVLIATLALGIASVVLFSERLRNARKRTGSTGFNTLVDSRRSVAGGIV